jgi:GNAT superfamily N-acetyltransferase
MRELTLAVDTSPVAADLAGLQDGLGRHALPITGVPGFVPLAIFLRDARGTVVGGVAARINWNWLDISLLWVDDRLRTTGWGGRLMEALEAEAVARGCTDAHVDTFSYQARPFYERLGYRAFAVLDDYPPGHQRIYLRKRLAGS